MGNLDEIRLFFYENLYEMLNFIKSKRMETIVVEHFLNLIQKLEIEKEPRLIYNHKIILSGLEKLETVDLNTKKQQI